MLFLEAFTAEEYRNTMEKIEIDYSWCQVNSTNFLVSSRPDVGYRQCYHCPNYSGGQCTNERKRYIYVTGKCNIKTLKLNVPALYPLRAKNNSSVKKSIKNVFVNKINVSNYVTTSNYIELPPPKGVILPDILPKGTKFFLLSPDDIPEHGTLILADTGGSYSWNLNQ